MTKEQKEAIEELEEFIKGPCETCKYCEAAYKLNRKNIIQLLSLNKKLQKENEELKNQEATARRINELLVQRYSNSIPVQKVKDNIEKLKAQYKTALEKNSTEAFILKCQITILQELLKESEE